MYAFRRLSLASIVIASSLAFLNTDLVQAGMISGAVKTAPAGVIAPLGVLGFSPNPFMLHSLLLPTAAAPRIIPAPRPAVALALPGGKTLEQVSILSHIVSAAQNPATAMAVIAASEPPASMTSASPRLMM